MLCLFRNSLIHPRLDPAAIALSWMGTLYWLYFAFIEKALFEKVTAGHALIVDLVFGLPLVFAVAIMIYATIYWGIKAILATVFPMALVPKEATEILDESMDELEHAYGDDYWDKDSASTAAADTTKNSDDLHIVPEGEKSATSSNSSEHPANNPTENKSASKHKAG